VTLGKRDKRALAALAIAAVVSIPFFLSYGSGSVEVANTSTSISTAERRLARLRRQAATVSGKQELLKQVSGELAQREKGIIQAETAAQAQAQLVDAVRHVASAQTPPVALGSVEFQKPTALGEYGEVRVAVPFTCQIDGLVNLLADLTKRPEAIATTELRITAQDQKQKTVSVRLVVSGLLPRRLVPEKKGGATF
jgi:hypothetical protein